MPDSQEKLQNLLLDLFKFDAADLDFGIYRVLNQRRDRVEQFIEKDLSQIVEDTLDDLEAEDRKELEEEVDEKRRDLTNNLEEDAVKPNGEVKEEYRGTSLAQEYQEARKRLEQAKTSDELAAHIFNDVYRFFSRYYDEGDFVAQRRHTSQDSKYCVPYDGQEVLFHWANKDQYYVKSSLHFNNYVFDTDDLKVEFIVTDAEEPTDNVKGEDRYFVLADDPIEKEDDELKIHFEHRQITEEEAESIVDDYNESADDDKKSFNRSTHTKLCTALESRILSRLDKDVRSQLEEEGDGGKTLLRKHVERFASENDQDYFIHKDLEGFLNRELDVFLKTELLNTEDLLHSDSPKSEPPMLRARAVRRIAEKIIEFIAKIEDFQKRLFEKKKFIYQTDYMVTVDKIPKRFYNDILENKDQLEQWRRVYDVNNWSKDLKWRGEFNEEFLDNHSHLMIDTALFGEEFKLKLLSTFENVEAEVDGVLFNSENFQTMSLLERRYQDEIDCTYLDPPYNTGGKDFLYKDDYRHSSWISMMADRLELSKRLMDDKAGIFAQIGGEEQANLRKVLENSFGSANFRNSIIVRRGIKNIQSQFEDISNLAVGHDTIFFFSKDPSARFPKLFKELEEGEPGKWDTFWRGTDRPTMRYELFGQKPEEGQWRWTEERTRQAIENYEEYRQQYDSDEHLDEYYLNHLEETGEELDFVREGEEGVPQYYVPPRNYKMRSTLWMDVRTRGDFTDFSTEKHTELVETIVDWITETQGTVLDFFAGSGSTGHAVLNLNREKEKEYNYVLVELDDQFDSVLRPRLMRYTFSDKWSDGQPRKGQGISQMIKYHRLESYEDSLNNVRMKEPEPGQVRLVDPEDEEYVINYMFDLEPEGSPSLLTEDAFDTPFQYTIEIQGKGNMSKRGGDEQTGSLRSPEPEEVDLVETFHYLLGAKVRQYWQKEHQGRRYVVTKCEVEKEHGTDEVLTVWRPTEDLDYEQEAEWFAEAFSEEDVDTVYVNGESQIDNWKPLEPVFRERMEADTGGA